MAQIKKRLKKNMVQVKDILQEIGIQMKMFINKIIPVYHVIILH